MDSFPFTSYETQSQTTRRHHNIRPCLFVFVSLHIYFPMISVSCNRCADLGDPPKHGNDLRAARRGQNFLTCSEMNLSSVVSFTRQSTSHSECLPQQYRTEVVSDGMLKTDEKMGPVSRTTQQTGSTATNSF